MAVSVEGSTPMRQALEGFLAAQPGIDQETGPLGGHQCGVASAGRRKYRNGDDGRCSRLLARF